MRRFPKSAISVAQGFTLIELLIVIAIILILIAIALPNFLEAQIRSRVTRANAEMRSLITATASYRNIYNRAPDPQNVITSSDFDRNWWGFASNKLTTPSAYIKTIPVDIFPDVAKGSLRYGWPGPDHTIPYAVVVRANAKAPLGPKNFMWLGAKQVSNWEYFDPVTLGMLRRSWAVYISAGPDTRMTWQYAQVNAPGFTPAPYSPTNGTMSNGDIFGCFNF